jgi:hypothetical protein
MPVGMTGELVAGRYRMERRIGAGGMAAVFLAKDCRLERNVAIKRLHSDSPEDVAQRFTREAKLGASLNHPNVVAVYDTLTDDEGVLIVMEYVPGHTLRDEIARGPMAPDRALDVLAALASALDHAHDAGVVHRDIKPANVLIDDTHGAVKLADLGIATAAERTRITASGNVLGTAAYMAPERLDGRPGGPAVDIYALAAMAFEMLSGRKAIEGSTPLEIARRVATAPPPDLREVVDDAPPAAADVLVRGLAKDPDERPASAGQLVRELAGAYAARAEEEERERREAAAASAAAAAAPAAAVPAAAPVAPAAPIEPTTAPKPAPVSDETTAPRGPREPTTSPRVHRGSRRPGWLAPAGLAALGVAALAVLAILLASSGGSDKPAAQRSAEAPKTAKAKHKPPAAQPSGSTGSTGSTGSSGSGSSPAPTPAPPPAPAPTGGGTAATDASTPTGAVSAFYTLAAKDDFAGAWRPRDRLRPRRRTAGDADRPLPRQHRGREVGRRVDDGPPRRRRLHARSPFLTRLTRD